MYGLKPEPFTESRNAGPSTTSAVADSAQDDTAVGCSGPLVAEAPNRRSFDSGLRGDLRSG
jgi:hypothetical protein